MNHTLAMTLASLGGLLWLIAAVRERYKISTGETLSKLFRPVEETKILRATDMPTTDMPTTDPTDNEITIESLERELGIKPDHYLCDRIGRISKALIARRDKQTPRKKEGTQ